MESRVRMESLGQPDTNQTRMKTNDPFGTEATRSAVLLKKLRRRVKPAALMLLLAGIGFFTTGCYDDRYGYRSVHTGYHASYGGPSPYYGYDPYPYGYGYGPRYGTGVAVGVSSYRSYPRGYDGYGYRRYGYSNRRWDRRRGDRRQWDRRRSGDGRRTWEERKSRRERGRAIRRSTAPMEAPGAPIETQPE